MRQGSRTGFTLIELLVVIAIVAILAAILFPVFTAAKQRAMCSACLNNEKQLAFAFRAYMDDNNGRMPRIDPWRRMGEMFPPAPWGGYVYPQGCWPEKGSLWPYTRTRGVYLCSVDRGMPAEHIQGRPRDYPLSYSANYEMGYERLDACPNRRTSRIMLLIHESRKTINDGYLCWRQGGDDLPSNVHYEGSNIALVDCHAAYLNYKELMKRRGSGEWDPDPGKPPPE